MKLAAPPINPHPCTMHASSNPNQSSTATCMKSSLIKCSSSTGPLHRPPASTSSSGQSLRDKWMELQGIRNWEGLLDPLDGRLRSEILRYGEFVEAAYRSLDSESSILLDNNGSYKVTRHLHATCGVHLPASWTASWITRRSSWIGYVAVCTDEREIERLGRRDVVVAYRGTVTCMEWVENFRATLTCLLDDVSSSPGGAPMVRSGLLSMYTSSSGDEQPSLRDEVREEIGRIVREYADDEWPMSVTVTGHSLGAALATLTAHDITTMARSDEKLPLVTVVSFGGPRVGNDGFRCQLERGGAKVLRIVNSDDPVTRVPGFVMRRRKATWVSEWVRRRVEGTHWEYAEVGNELRLSSRDCPNLNVATCHDLRTYLQLVDNFVSSELSCKCRGSDDIGLIQTKNEAQ